MNRLIILGNGFDLAHGLETRYNDFIKWYLKKCFSQSLSIGVYEDDLLWIQKTRYATVLWYSIKNPVAEFIDQLFQTNGFSAIIQTNTTNFDSTPFIIKFKSDFFADLLTKCTLATWVGIENEYYEQLKEILYGESGKEKNLSKLNNAFGYITKQLEEYLKTIQPTHLNSSFSSIFEGPINKNEIIISKLADGEAPKDTLVLNFNYTSTVEHYFKNNDYSLPPKKLRVNYIHGGLGDENNPIIFGFGDELDSDYAKMELEKIHGYFDHIKSFGYFKTSNYHNLIRFLDAEEYQVFILGHSCGLSDRTMLNMIFEHQNCKSIKIYYYVDENGTNNFTPLTEEISRHFKDKAMMRRKIVPFDKSSPMPQVD